MSYFNQLIFWDFICPFLLWSIDLYYKIPTCKHAVTWEHFVDLSFLFRGYENLHSADLEFLTCMEHLEFWACSRGAR